MTTTIHAYYRYWAQQFYDYF